MFIYLRFSMTWKIKEKRASPKLIGKIFDRQVLFITLFTIILKNNSNQKLMNGDSDRKFVF